MQSMTSRSSSLSGFLMVGCLALASVGCGYDQNLREEGQSDTSFISHVPGAARGDVDNVAGEGSGGSSSSGGSSNSSVDEDGGEEAPERLIAEADIIKVEGSRLYALSRYSGLS